MSRTSARRPGRFEMKTTTFGRMPVARKSNPGGFEYTRGGHIASTMNDDRYRSYLFISQVFRSDLFNALERDVLTDAAEGLLLAREPGSPELDELELNVDAALEGMTAGGRIHAATASELRERLHDCGPRELTLAA